MKDFFQFLCASQKVQTLKSVAVASVEILSYKITNARSSIDSTFHLSLSNLFRQFGTVKKHICTKLYSKLLLLLKAVEGLGTF